MPTAFPSPTLPPATRGKSAQSRIQGALWGLLVGDSLGVPTHFYEHRELLARDYADLNGLERPRHPHPESKLWRDPLPALPPEWDAFAGRRELWARPGCHPHATLEAGDNTLDAHLALILLETAESEGQTNGTAFLSRLEKHIRPMGGNRDLWMSPPVRSHLVNRAAGRPPGRFAEPSQLMGGLVTALPLALWHHADPWAAQQAARSHLGAVHPGEVIPGAIGLLATIAHHLLNDDKLTLGQLVLDRMDRLSHGALGFPYRRSLAKNDAEVLGGALPLTENVEDGLPAALYLALKYERSPRDGLLVSAKAGGDTCGRGALLGFLLGLSGGLPALPEEWLAGLEEFEAAEAAIGATAARLGQG